MAENTNNSEEQPVPDDSISQEDGKTTEISTEGRLKDIEDKISQLQSVTEKMQAQEKVLLDLKQNLEKQILETLVQQKGQNDKKKDQNEQAPDRKNIHGSDIYPMTNRQKGKLLILNLNDFEEYLALEERRGTDYDVDRLRTTFENMGFCTEVARDLDVSAMMTRLRRAADDFEEDNDWFACVILSHGEEGSVWAKDAKIAISQLLLPFHNAYVSRVNGKQRKSNLRGKPKLFFIQACRGHRKDLGVPESDSSPFGTLSQAEQMPDSYGMIPSSMTDFFLAQATVQDYGAYRSPTCGTWFIQALCDVIDEQTGSVDLPSVMTEVNYKLAYEYGFVDKHGFTQKQMPCFTSMLTKKLIFTRTAP